jgi:hypothetical protein
MRVFWRAMLLSLLLVGSAAAQPTLSEHRDPKGFLVHIPAGWTVDSPTLERITITSPDRLSFAQIEARLARGPLVEWLGREWAGGEPWITSATILSSTDEGGGAARAILDIVDRQGTSRRVHVAAVRQGDIATVYAAAAPPDRHARDLPQLAAVLDSFRFTGVAPPSAKPSALRFTGWVDPLENAFSTEVPQGWHVDGGLYRVNGGRAAGAMTVSSPDGSTVLFSGDASLPLLVLPNPTIMSLGYQEGGRYSSDGGQSYFMISRFREAADFGAELIQSRLGRVQFTQVRPRPDLAGMRQQITPVLGGAIPQFTSADLDFTLPDGRVGTLTISTSVQEVPGLGGTWTVDDLYGFLAPADQAGTAAAALGHLMGATRLNPAWFAREMQANAEAIQRNLEYRNHVAQLQQQTLNDRWASQDRQIRQMRDVLGGTVRLADPVSGETFEARAGARYYYRITDANPPAAIGTDVDSQPMPQIDMRRLLQVGTEAPDP